MILEARKFGVALVAFGALALGGCSQPTGASDEENVIGGTPDSGDPAVFAILQSSSATKRLCSSTLVSPHVLVSAAHCFVPDIEGDHRINWIVKGDDADTPWPWKWSSTSSENLHPHPDYISYLYGFDIAVVVLDDAQDATPVPLQRAPMTDSDVGTKVRFVGYGRTNPDDANSARKKNQVTLTTNEVRNDRFSASSTPDEPYANTCFGDSGGPGFITRDGVEYLAGVTSYGGANCTGSNTSTRVDVFASFIDPYILQYDPDYAAQHGIQAAAPAPEPPPMP